MFLSIFLNWIFFCKHYIIIYALLCIALSTFMHLYTYNYYINIILLLYKVGCYVNPSRWCKTLRKQLGREFFSRIVIWRQNIYKPILLFFPACSGTRGFDTGRESGTVGSLQTERTSITQNPTGRYHSQIFRFETWTGQFFLGLFWTFILLKLFTLSLPTFCSS